VSQLLTESVLLAVLGGIAASLLALIALRFIRGIMPESITFFAPYAIGIEWRTLVFTFVVAALVGMLVGVAPALRATRIGSAAAQAGLTPYAAGMPVKSRLRRALIVGEVALSVMLLIGAGLLIHSFVRLVRVDPGFRMENLAVMRLNLSEASYPSAEARSTFLRRLEQRLEALPGVEGVAVNAGVPPSGGFSFGVSLEAEGARQPSGAQPQLLPFAHVPPDFFQVLEVPVVAGRAFTHEDAGTDHAIIDRELARFLWAGTNPVGRRFRVGAESHWLTVVGVVRDLRMMGPDNREGQFEILYPLGPNEAPSYVPLAIRTRGDPQPLLRSFRAAVHELDSRQPIEELRPASEFYAETIDMPRFLLVLMSILSGLALLLAAIGIYGVLAAGVVQRRRELGIRIALGAPLGRVSWEVLREGFLLAGVGAMAGTAAALALSKLIQGLLYDVAPTDLTTIAVVVLVSMTTAAVACYWPARRATRIDPVEVLKAE
jgi:predicted permease